MDDLGQRIDKFNSLKNINFYSALIIIFFMLGVTIWALPQANNKGEYVLLLYIFTNLIISLFIAFRFLKITPRSKIKGDLNRYHQNHLAKTFLSNELGAFFFIVPTSLGTLGIWAIDYTNDSKPVYWIYITFVSLMLFIIYRWWVMRKYLRREHKKIYDSDFFSFFHF